MTDRTYANERRVLTVGTTLCPGLREPVWGVFAVPHGAITKQARDDGQVRAK